MSIRSTSSFRHVRGWPGRVLAGVSLSVLVAGPAAAQSNAPYHHGQYGWHELREPGATCAIVSNRLKRIRVKSPVVYAHDADPSAVDRQMVAWRYVIEASNDQKTWRTYHRSSLQRAEATEQRPAAFVDFRRFRFTEDARAYEDYACAFGCCGTQPTTSRAGPTTGSSSTGMSSARPMATSGESTTTPRRVRGSSESRRVRCSARVRRTSAAGDGAAALYGRSSGIRFRPW